MTSNTFYTLAVFAIVLLIITKPIGLWLTPIAQGRAPAVVDAIDRRLISVLAPSGREESWQRYAVSLLTFNTLGLIFLYVLQRIQGWLPLNPQGFEGVAPDQAFNTAVSFVTNTNWQSYGGEMTMSYLTQMLGMGVQNFLSAATGIAVAFALMRGFSRHESSTIGCFAHDVIRITLWVLLPMCLTYALFLVSQGVIQNMSDYLTVTTLAGDSQSIAMGPVASQEAVKLLGTNGGGFFNVNSAHPFENPTPLTNFLEALAIFAIPTGLTYAFGRMVGHQREGWMLWQVMGALFVLAFTAFVYTESTGNPLLQAIGAEGLSWEGKDARFDLGALSLFSTVTTSASCGAVAVMHDSLMPLSGMVTMVLMQLGEVVFGGVGAGFYGMIVMAVIAVFIASLMVGRTPEYLGKKITPKEMKLAALTMLTVPFIVLAGTGINLMLPGALESLNNPGAHGLSEILYAWTSAANNNGSAFAGLNANTAFYNIGLAIAMWLGRFIVIVLTLALAGTLARERHVPSGKGTLDTASHLFAGLLIGVVLLVGALTYLPVLALGPVAEMLSLL
ncbi:MAG: potassium-transporting ATPase subunit KdpA [Sutterella wadsworthensis]|mgnify:FL=1|jgi:K+-transporting ATPase ATPase A chain|uniref:Potassium-transporting ATPase potassium-binding subunit n=1 Tax=Sutterella wadsworthensis 2_1_59BFAA TaxID=742823 RepID=K1JQ25_9BURK|nr:potassium-transporting ATPase subunit KdpA [Sutterella wadsworthensis]EKB32301.1 K+-transporting ATPase, A subunit [Sutterella wadsworthensis 2_1_59BFAA]